MIIKDITKLHSKIRDTNICLEFGCREEHHIIYFNPFFKCYNRLEKNNHIFNTILRQIYNGGLIQLMKDKIK